MLFELKTTGHSYHGSNPDIEPLKELGFEFKEKDNHRRMMGSKVPYYYIEGKPTIEIITIEELMSLHKKVSEDLIIGEDFIEIYNDYRE